MKSPSVYLSRLMPQEEQLKIKTNKAILTIGVPKEHTYQENRVALCPESIELLVAQEHQVLVERGAGHAAGFSDNDFSEAGAEIVDDKTRVFQSQIIVKVAPPTLDEINMMANNRVLISALHSTCQNAEYFKLMVQKKITALSFELIKDHRGMFPILCSMSEITGYTVVQIAAEYLSKPDLGRGAILGSISGITPSEVVIIGAGTIGEYAARAALGHGAIVKVFDNKLYKLRSLQSKLGERIFTSIIHPKVLQKAIKSADVVIGAIHSEFGKSQIIVTEDMVKSMKKGTIIIDASIDQGGCIETSKPTNHTEPIFQFSGVNHYCVPNIPSRVPRTASYALSNFLTPFLLDLSENAGIEKLLVNKPGYRHGTYILHGILTNKHIGERFGLSHQDIELLIMALRA